MCKHTSKQALKHYLERIGKVKENIVKAIH